MSCSWGSRTNDALAESQQGAIDLYLDPVASVIGVGHARRQPGGAIDPGHGLAAATVMQGDGNFAVYGAASRWASGTDGFAEATLAIQDDGNLVLYRRGVAVWASGTDGR